MALKDIFAEPQSLGDVLKVSAEGADLTADTTTGAPVEAMAQITGDLLKKTKVLVPLNFESIPMKYSNWDTVQSVVSVHEPKVFRVCEDGTRSGPVAVAFVSDKATDLTLAKAEGTKTGFKGVNTLPDRPNPRFYARAGTVNLGCFETAEQAALEIARYQAKEKVVKPLPQLPKKPIKK